MKREKNGRITGVLVCLAVGLSALVSASDVGAATIGLGGVGGYYFGWDQNSNADGNVIPQAMSATNLYHRLAGSNESTNQNVGGPGGEIVFHFQSDPGTLIETASVESDIRVWWPTAGITGSWSTDNANWTQFVSVQQPGPSDMDYNLIPLTGLTASNNLYLKYNLTGSNKGSACLFISDNRFAKDTFRVEGTIIPVPEPATICLLGVGGCLALLRKRK